MKKALGSLLLERGINVVEFLEVMTSDGDAARCSMCGDAAWPWEQFRYAGLLLCADCACRVARGEPLDGPTPRAPAED